MCILITNNFLRNAINIVFESGRRVQTQNYRWIVIGSWINVCFWNWNLNKAKIIAEGAQALIIVELFCEIGFVIIGSMHLKGDLSVKVFVFMYMGNELVPSLHKWIFHLRIEMQNFNLHWMMQNIRLFNVCEARRASRRH